MKDKTMPIFLTAMVLAIATTISDFFIHYTWDATHLFFGIMFMMLSFDYLYDAKKTKNPYDKIYNKLIGVLSIFITFICLTLFIIQHYIFPFILAGTVFIGILMFIFLQIVMRRHLLKYNMHYEELKWYSKKIYNLAKLQHKLINKYEMTNK